MKTTKANNLEQLIEELELVKAGTKNIYIKYLCVVMQLELKCSFQGHKHYTCEDKRNLMTAYSHVTGDEPDAFYLAAMMLGDHMQIYPAGLFGQICRDKFEACELEGMHRRSAVDVKIAILSFDRIDCPIQFIDTIYAFCANDSQFVQAA